MHIGTAESQKNVSSIRFSNYPEALCTACNIKGTPHEISVEKLVVEEY